MGQRDQNHEGWASPQEPALSEVEGAGVRLPGTTDLGSKPLDPEMKSDSILNAKERHSAVAGSVIKCRGLAP